MKYININLNLLLLGLSLSFCTPTKDMIFCDNADSELVCTEIRTENDVTYLDKVKFQKTNPTNEDFANFLYFQARETPGLLLEKMYYPKTSETEWNATAVYLAYGNSEEKMEGKRGNGNRIFFFHYLGSLLKEELRHLGVEKSPFELERFKKIELYYRVKIPNQSEILRKRELQLVWK